MQGIFTNEEHGPKPKPERHDVGGVELLILPGCDTGDPCAWLGTGIMDFDGLCVASKPTRAETLTELREFFEAGLRVVKELQNV